MQMQPKQIERDDDHSSLRTRLLANFESRARLGVFAFGLRRIHFF